MVRTNPRLVNRTGRQLRQLQRDRIRLTQEFLDRCDPEAVTAECQSKTADLIERIIIRYPDCPLFASLLVDLLLVGQEALAEAIEEELD